MIIKASHQTQHDCSFGNEALRQNENSNWDLFYQSWNYLCESEWKNSPEAIYRHIWHETRENMATREVFGVAQNHKCKSHRTFDHLEESMKFFRPSYELNSQVCTNCTTNTHRCVFQHWIYSLVAARSHNGPNREVSPLQDALPSSRALHSFLFRLNPESKSRVDRKVIAGTLLCKERWVINEDSDKRRKKITRNLREFPSKLMLFAMAKEFDARSALELGGEHVDAAEHESETSGNA